MFLEPKNKTNSYSYGHKFCLYIFKWYKSNHAQIVFCSLTVLTWTDPQLGPSCVITVITYNISTLVPFDKLATWKKDEKKKNHLYCLKFVSSVGILVQNSQIEIK